MRGRVWKTLFTLTASQLPLPDDTEQTLRMVMTCATGVCVCVCVCVCENAMKSFIRIRWDEEECEHTVAQITMLTHYTHKNVWMSNISFILSSTKKKQHVFVLNEKNNTVLVLRFLYFFGKEVSYYHQDCIYLIKNTVNNCTM